jgi:hypothetical protein
MYLQVLDEDEVNGLWKMQMKSQLVSRRFAVSHLRIFESILTSRVQFCLSSSNIQHSYSSKLYVIARSYCSERRLECSDGQAQIVTQAARAQETGSARWVSIRVIPFDCESLCSLLDSRCKGGGETVHRKTPILHAVTCFRGRKLSG